MNRRRHNCSGGERMHIIAAEEQTAGRGRLGARGFGKRRRPILLDDPAYAPLPAAAAPC